MALHNGRTCDRCGHDFSTLRKCTVCERRICGGCSWVSTLNEKRVCAQPRCVKANKRKALAV